MTNFPLKCKCNDYKWEIHPNHISCCICGFKEYFEIHEDIMTIVNRMKLQGCYFLDNDANKLENKPIVQIKGLYR